MNSGLVNWPPIKTRRIQVIDPAAPAREAAETAREKSALDVVATNLGQLKAQVVQTIQRL